MNTHHSYVWSLCMSFRYPFQGDGLYVLIVGDVMSTIVDYLSAYASIFEILIRAGIAGYFTAFAKDMVRMSAMGEDTSPNWADFSDWISDLLTTVIELLVVLAMSFGPLIFLLFKHPAATAAVKTLWLVAGTWGCLTFPILFLAVAMMDSIQAVINPIHINFDFSLLR